jgi:hypothetical protein
MNMVRIFSLEKMTCSWKNCEFDQNDKFEFTKNR